MHALCPFLLSTIAFILLPLSFAQSTLTVFAPANATVCEISEFSWEGGVDPWLLSVISAAPPNIEIDDLGSTINSSFSWRVEPNDFNSGNPVMLRVLDGNGDVGQSDPFTIEAGLPTGGRCLVGNIRPSGGANSGIPDSPDSNTPSAAEGPASSSATPAEPSSHSPSSFAAPTPPTSSSITTAASNPPTSAASSAPPPAQLAFSSSSAASSVTGLLSSTPTSSSANAPTPSAPQATIQVGAPGPASIPTTATSSSTLSSANSANSGQSSTSDLGASKKNAMTGPIVGGVIAGILCVLVAVFCAVRYNRRRRSRLDTASYPFALKAASSSSRGRSGYAASVASSWGNRGDLAERALSPSTEALHSWEPEQGTIESRYQGAFAPGHSTSSPSNDWSDQRRMRGQRQNDASDAGAAAEHVPDSPRSTDASELTPIFQARTVEMPSWTAMHSLMKHQPVIGYPPPYSSI